jgi:ribonuclease P protein subunit RPR2
MVRLLVCDDSREARVALRAMLAASEIEIVGEAADGAEAVALALQLRPDVVLMDVGMPVVDGIAATRRLRELVPTARIVAFTGADEVDVVMAMMDAGASDYCVKGAPLWELERAIIGAHEPLLRLAHSLARSLHGGGTADTVAAETAELSGAVLAAVYLSTAEGGASLAAAAGAAAAFAPRNGPALVHRALASRSLAEATAPELADLYTSGVACGETVAAPLLSDAEALGALVVAMPAAVGQDIDRELVAAVADLAAASLANERRLAFTHAEARRDALTGLPNRRAFDEHLAQVCVEGAEVALGVFDLDDFKRVNDLEGHAVGDEVLRDVGRVVQRTLRVDEDAFRIGGDEFAFVIAGDAGEAMRVGERMRRSFREQRRGHLLPTLSIGVAGFPTDADIPDELLRRADVALYGAKWAGKDQVVAYGGDVAAPSPVEPTAQPPRRLRLLVVDDDALLRLLLRTTFEVVDVEVREAATAADAEREIAADVPHVVVLDVALPGTDGVAFCRALKGDERTRDVGVVLLTASPDVDDRVAEGAGADALLRKPFSPLELLEIIERIAGLSEGPFRPAPAQAPHEQLLLYAQDLKRLLQIERRQRALLQHAYRQTVTALATALDSKDTGTAEHSERVRRYAAELARSVEPSLLDDPSLEYGFLLHDVGKIGVPEAILLKPGELTQWERKLMERHTVVGEQMLGDVALLQGEGLRVVRFHHERWDGSGYPDRLAGSTIPLGARVFAVADALDAMTSDRPYRIAGSWDDAVAEIVGEAEKQFDPDVVDAFRSCEPRLRRIHDDVSAR